MFGSSRIDTRWLVLGGLALVAVLLNAGSIDLARIALIGAQFLLLSPAIILHEVSHGYVAYLLGDPTAKRMGRLTLNPLAHVDPVGTVIMPLLLLLMSGGRFFFGYAKPVPFNPRNFRDERTGMLLTGLAGPATNVILAILVGLIVRFFPDSGPAWFGYVYEILYYFAYFNLVLAFFNLVPVPPLDGSRVVQWILPDSLRDAYHRLERFGFVILIALTWLVPGLFGAYLSLTVDPVFALITGGR